MMDNSVENRLYRLEARAEVENIIGTYCHLLFAGEGGQIMDELWSRSEEVSIEIGASGRYSTREKVATYYQKDHIAGKFTLLLPVTPVIETAADGRSARGMWFVLGLDSDAGDLGTGDSEERALLTSKTAEGKAYRAECAVWRLGADFIREGEQWRILHLHQYDLVRFPCGSDWVRFAEERYATDGIRLDAMFRSNLPFAEERAPENLANSPTPYHWQYRVDGRTEKEPKVPKPYETYSEADRY